MISLGLKLRNEPTSLDRTSGEKKKYVLIEKVPFCEV